MRPPQRQRPPLPQLRKRSRERPTSTTNPTPKKPFAAEAFTYNVAGLLAEPAGTTREIGVSTPELDLESEVRQHGGLDGHIRLTRTNRGLFVHARMRTAIAQECSRCLRELDWPVEVELDEEALPSVDLTSGLPLDVASEPEVLRLNDHHELELGGEVRDAIVLAEPIAPLCRDDCPGLCPTCGQELASGVHDHPDDDIDPRMESLRHFGEGGGTDGP